MALGLLSRTELVHRLKLGFRPSDSVQNYLPPHPKTRHFDFHDSSFDSSLDFVLVYFLDWIP